MPGSKGPPPQKVVSGAEKGKMGAVLAWLDGGGWIDATHEGGDVGGVTLLMLSANNGRERVVDLLLRYGAEVGLQDGDGWTALDYAALNGRPIVVRRLLRAGADTALCAANALQIAEEEGHSECVEALRAYLGEVAGRRKVTAAEALAIGTDALAGQASARATASIGGAEAASMAGSPSHAVDAGNAETRAGAGGASSGAAAAAADAPLLDQRVVLGGLSARPELTGSRA